jgi:hypothetical protein
MSFQFEPSCPFDKLYECVVVHPDGSIRRITASMLVDLARETAYWHVRPRHAWSWKPAEAAAAWAPSGRPLNVQMLAAFGRRLLGQRKRPANWPVYRHGPVPGTRCRGRYAFFRHPATQAERRAHALVLSDDGEPPVRGARRPRSLPHAWWDIDRHSERCWKHFRRHQYKTAR